MMMLFRARQGSPPRGSRALLFSLALRNAAASKMERDAITAPIESADRTELRGFLSAESLKPPLSTERAGLLRPLRAWIDA
jgi:hypothetical protein